MRLVEVCRHLQVTEATYYRLRNQCGARKLTARSG